MIVPGGTPSVTPLSVARYGGRPATAMFGADEPGTVLTTVVHGFVTAVAGCEQPAIGAPTSDGSHSTSPPPATTCVWPGISVTMPPWLQTMIAFVVTIGGKLINQYCVD
ncbi:MAG: hypothetical protein QOE31_1097 [Solirubrobacteraceae bacterium]|jgi:hypothetical protein|nr:hypothetical protein [Solirubrobacteraceae bacterium]